MDANKRIGSLVYPELSYQLMGALFTVHNKLGNTYQEKYYQRAIEVELTNLGISFVREKEITIGYGNIGIGKYFLDFIVDSKIVLEIKTTPGIAVPYERQLLAYLESANMKLGIVANFRTDKLTYRRLINPHVKIT